MRLNLKIISLFLIACLFSGVIAQTEIRKCSVKTLIGSVKIRRGASVNWVDARPGMPLKEKDAIRTFIESEAELEISDGSSMKIGENSTIELATFFSKKEIQNTKVKILNGSLISNVKKLVNTESSFEFETSTATAAIRGTIVSIDVNNEKTRIKVYEGRVQVSAAGSGSTIVLKENQMTSVVKGQKEIIAEKLEEKPSSRSELLHTEVPDSSQNRSDTLSNGLSAYSVKSPADTSKQVDSLQLQSDKMSAASDNPVSIKLILQSPPDNAVFEPSAPVLIAGTIFPSGASVTLNGTSIPVSTNGSFRYTKSAPAQPGSVEFTIAGEYKNATQAIVRHFTVKNAAVEFSVSSPSEGQEIARPVLPFKGRAAPGAEITVNSVKQNTAPDGSFSGQIIIPDKPGEFQVDFEMTVNGKNQRITRAVYYKPPLQFSVISPSERQEVSKTLIPVNGKVTPGAEVLVNGMKVLVTSDGSFNGQIAIPNEEGEITVEFEAVLGSAVQRLTRIIYYKPQYRFLISSPSEKQLISSTIIPVKGEVQPPSSEIVINGRKLIVASNGSFSGMVSIPDIEGNVQLEFDITSSGVSRTEYRNITYKRPPDTNIPVIQGILPDKPSGATVSFTVIDRTVDEEITFFYEIDGVKNSEKGTPNTPFTIALEEGIHSYKIYAEDKAKNRSAVISKSVAYLVSGSWSIQVRKPSGSEFLDLPPSAPDDSYKPRYTVELSIEKLPNDNMQLIREVIITNQTTGESAQERSFTSNFIQKDFDCALRRTNVFLIEVTDINGVKKSQRAQVVLR